MRSAATKTGKVGGDLGKDFENAVYLLLRRKVADVSYWKGKGEVDFVINTRQGLTPIQVTMGAPQQRHEAALEEFYQQFPYANEAIYVNPDSYRDLSVTLESDYS